MAFTHLLFASLLLGVVQAAVTWTATPFNPPSVSAPLEETRCINSHVVLSFQIPLAVRTPYLSAWLNQGSGTALNAAWPSFWTGSVGST